MNTVWAVMQGKKSWDKWVTDGNGGNICGAEEVNFSISVQQEPKIDYTE